MNSIERKAVISLATILSLRLLGLFMALPLFSLYAAHLKGATPALIGLGMGSYGLTQAIFQIPLGTLSDYLGRKRIICLGLCIFALGSLVAFAANSIWALLVGRALQGAGAVGSTIMALMSDLTSIEERTKAMAIAGMSIGFSFALAMILGPLLANWIQVNGIFMIAALLSIVAIIILYKIVPEPSIMPYQIVKESGWRQFQTLIKHPELARLNIGIFFLHLIFTATFVVLPLGLQSFAGLSSNQQWIVYLPIVLLAFLFSIPGIVFAEKKHRVKEFFLASVTLLTAGELLFSLFSKNLLLFSFSLLLFITAFSLLEAFLPSLVSRTAPPERKGTALGIYSFSQFFGMFVGGILGGWLYGEFGLTQVYLVCMLPATIWLAIAFHMKNPHYSTQCKFDSQETPTWQKVL